MAHIRLVEGVTKAAKDDLQSFYNDLNAELEKIGASGYDTFDEFEEELEDYGGGGIHLYNVASDDEYDAWCKEHGDSDDGYTGHYFEKADSQIKKLTAALKQKYRGFSFDSDKDDTQIFVMLSVDGMDESCKPRV